MNRMSKKLVISASLSTSGTTWTGATQDYQAAARTNIGSGSRDLRINVASNTAPSASQTMDPNYGGSSRGDCNGLTIRQLGA